VLLLLLRGLQDAYDTWFDAADPQKPRGRVLIIANSIFCSLTLPKRDGTAVDVEQLNRVFTWLNFDVDIRENLTSQVSYNCLVRITVITSSLLMSLYVLLK